MHLTLVPYIATAGETKTKPTQHSVKELRSIGLQPDILLCRSEVELDEGQRKKIALFTNVEERAVISMLDAKTIYAIPRDLQRRGLDQIVVDRLGFDCGTADLSDWDEVVENQLNPKHAVTIAMVGKYMELLDAYKSLNEALNHAGIRSQTKVNIRYIDSEVLEDDMSQLDGCDAILVPGGFGVRGVEGKIKAVNYARVNKVPYLGICLGMQVAMIEFARNVCHMDDANSTEFDAQSPYPVIGLITEWVDTDGNIEKRSKDSDMGGTMRLGTQKSYLVKGTMAHAIYGADEILERHRHRYEVNNNYVPQFQEAGLTVGGWSENRTLVETVEIPDHPWFFACQFHPEFTSTPRQGHPLFNSFVQAALTQSERQGDKAVGIGA
jgi:CTP synthase